MALIQSYLMTTKNLGAMLAAIQTAKAPERFTTRFLNQLDFKSTNDRLFIGVLKGLGLIDESGIPTKRYYAFLDQAESKRVLAEAIREAYEDLFAINVNAQDLSVEDVKGKFKTLTQGSKSDNVIGLMAATFKALTGLADWTHSTAASKSTSPDKLDEAKSAAVGSEAVDRAAHINTHANRSTDRQSPLAMQLRYDIHIHLPESRDPAVFDAIFDALSRHLG